MRPQSMGVAVLLAAALSGACNSSSDVTAPSPPVSVPPVDSQPDPAPPPPPVSSSCDHTRAQWAVGQRASADLLERARLAAGAKSARFLRPNEVVTLEYLASRLNLELDTRNIVRSAVCW